MTYYNFFFKIFNFADNSWSTVVLGKSFLDSFNKYLDDNQLNFSVEDIVAFYYVHEKKLKITREYLERSHDCDLYVDYPSGDVVCVEVKSETDGIRLRQLDFLIKAKGLIIWVLFNKEAI
jgi:hypothetical protein